MWVWAPQMDHPEETRAGEGRRRQKESRKSSDFRRNSSCALGAVSFDLTAELSKFVETRILESFMCTDQ